MTGNDAPRRGRSQWSIALALVVATAVGVAVFGAGIAVADPIDRTTLASDEEAWNESLAEPNVSVYLPDNEVSAGTDAQLLLEVANEGHPRDRSDSPDILAARGVSLEVTDPGPFEIRSDQRSLGTIQDGGVSTAEVGISVPSDLRPGEYEIETTVAYGYIDDDADENVTRPVEATETVRVEVRSEPRFELETIDSDVRADRSGEVRLQLTNVGQETASAAEATIAGGGGLVVDDGSTDVFLGTLEPGQSTRITVDARLTEEASVERKPIEATVSYRDANDVPRESAPRSANVTPGPEQAFEVLFLEDTLSVGYEGEITGTFLNRGPETLEDGVLVIEPATETVFVEESRYALPELEAGEQTDFVYPADVSGQADPGPRQVRFTLEYDSGGSEPAVSDQRTDRIVVDERQPEFDVTGDVAVEAGDSTEFILEITNNRPVALSDINAQVYADDPLSVDSDEAYVDALEPGESAEISFQVGVDGDAMIKTYPIELDFQYDTPGGDTQLSDTYQHPIDIVEADDDGGLLGGLAGGLGLAILAGTVLVIAAAIVLYRRRTGDSSIPTTEATVDPSTIGDGSEPAQAGGSSAVRSDGGELLPIGDRDDRSTDTFEWVSDPEDETE